MNSRDAVSTTGIQVSDDSRNSFSRQPCSQGEPLRLDRFKVYTGRFYYQSISRLSII